MLCPGACIILSSVKSIHVMLKYSYNKCKLSICIIVVLVGGGQGWEGIQNGSVLILSKKSVSAPADCSFFLSSVFVIFHNQISKTISIVGTLEFGMFMQDARRGNISQALVFSSYDVIRLEFMR